MRSEPVDNRRRYTRLLKYLAISIFTVWVIATYRAGSADRSVTHTKVPLNPDEYVLTNPGIQAHDLQLVLRWRAQREGGTFGPNIRWVCFESSLPPEEFESRFNRIVEDFNSINAGKLKYVTTEADDGDRFLRASEDWKMKWAMRGLLPPKGTRYKIVQLEELSNVSGSLSNWWIFRPQGKSMIIYHNETY